MAEGHGLGTTHHNTQNIDKRKYILHWFVFNKSFFNRISAFSNLPDADV